MRRKCKLAIYIFLGSLLLAEMACSITGPADTTRANQLPTMESGPTATFDHASADTYLGDYVAQNGYFFDALEVQDPATAQTGADIKPGTRLVAVNVIVGNQTGKRLLFNYGDVKLLDADGRSHDSAGGVMPQGMQISIAYIDPGERVQGWIPYFLPKDEVPAQLKYPIDPANKQFVRLGLTPPPAGHTALRVDTSRTPPALPKLGEDAKSAAYTLRALQVEDPSKTNYPHIYAPAEGTRFVAVEIKIANLGASMVNFDDFNVALVDTNGFVINVEFYGREGKIPVTDIKPDASVQGWVSFTIPAKVKLESVKWVPKYSEASLWAGLSE
jgi:hypothetical protein